MSKEKEITIDGSSGEGGGQILRTSLTLSMLTGKTLRMKNIRAGRQKPGLLRQHLTCVKASARISSGYVEGAEMGSQSLYFEPGPIAGGVYEFSIGTAGSTSLVLQTILLPLLLADTASALTIEGGTHNGMSPPFEFLRDCYAPVVSNMGGNIELALERHGFFPAGGGKLRCDIDPASSLKPVSLTTRSKVRTLEATALLSGLSVDIAERELATLDRVLKLKNSSQQIRVVDRPVGPGNALWLTAEFDGHTEIFSEIGERGVRAEQVAKKLAKRYQDYVRSNALVGEHLADQLVLLLAVAGGGSFTTVKPSKHTRTNMETIKAFMDIDFSVTQRGRHWLIEVNT